MYNVRPYAKKKITVSIQQSTNFIDTNSNYSVHIYTFTGSKAGRDTIAKCNPLARTG